MPIQFLIPSPFYSKSNLLEFKNFPCFTRLGTTALRQSLNLTVQYYADPVV